MSDVRYSRAPSPPHPAGEPQPGRRTVTIRGRGDERYVPSLTARSARRRPAGRRRRRRGFAPDRVAMWAVVLCMLLGLIAAASAHAAG
jgi:hypothetical protein